MTGPPREDGHALRVIGRVESPLVDPSTAPKQGDEGAPDAWIDVQPALDDDTTRR